MGDGKDCWSRESEKRDEERKGWNEESLKFIKFGKTRKDTRWKRGEFVFVERVRENKVKVNMEE